MKLLTSLVLAVIVLVGCTQPVVIKNPDGTTTTNMVVDAKLAAALETGQAVVVATAPVNPWWPIATAALTAIGAIATAIAKVQTGRKNRVQAQLTSVIKGVNKKPAGAAKANIKAQAEADGTEDELKKTVKAVEAGII